MGGRYRNRLLAAAPQLRGQAVARIVAAAPATAKRAQAQAQRLQVAEALDQLKRLRATTQPEQNSANTGTA